MLVEPLYGKDGPFREASAREESKAAPEAAANAPAASAPARGSICVGSRVQDSEGTCGEIVEANMAWLTMRTDAGEERKVRKFTLKLVASGTGAAPEAAAASAAPARAPSKASGKGVVRVKLEDAAEPPGIGVGARVQDPEGICGEIVARSGAWLTMRTDAGEERNVRKFTLKLIVSGTGAAPAQKAAAMAAPVTSAASQPAGSDVRITRTRSRDERDAELRRNAIDVEAPTVTKVPEGERFTFCPPCADAKAAAAVDDDDANPDADADAADADEDDHDDEEGEDKGEEGEACAACGGTDTHPGNEIMLCDGDGCDGAWHQLCLRPAVVDVPEADEASPPPTHGLPLPLPLPLPYPYPYPYPTLTLTLTLYPYPYLDPDPDPDPYPYPYPYSRHGSARAVPGLPMARRHRGRPGAPARWEGRAPPLRSACAARPGPTC